MDKWLNPDTKTRNYAYLYLYGIESTSVEDSVRTYWAIKFLNFRVDFFSLLFIISLPILVEDRYQVGQDAIKVVSIWRSL